MQAALGGKKLIDLPSEIHLLTVIPIGSKDGLFVFNNMVAPKPDAS